MKNILIFLFLIVFLASGCRSTKTATESRTKTETSADIKETTASQLLVTIDTTKTSDTETTYQRTEYYQPVDDTAKIGPVKSVETLVIRKKTEAKGKTEAIKTESSTKTTLITESTATKTTETTKPAPAPLRWMWIFGILAICAGLIVYLRNSPLVKSVLLLLRKFLKI
ncbi:MAG: hypothetical protein A2066_12760 [Bacteroidetes bacterium GWB2_41_8]|nr:MAG: hypothetical protein A2066_12760 [Bacteroidetes bacterium GWB2_41_8]